MPARRLAALVLLAMALGCGRPQETADTRPQEPARLTVAVSILPEAWLARPKRGFGLPVRTWGAEEHLLGLLRERISDPASPLRQWIPPGRILDYFATRPLCYALYELWALVILECWLRSHPAVR